MRVIIAGAIIWSAVLQICVSAPIATSTAFHGTSAWRSLVGASPSAEARRAITVKNNIQLRNTRNYDLVDSIAQLFGLNTSKRQAPLDLVQSSPGSSNGKVIRTAARSYQQSGGSIPSSRYYTTRKDSLPMISVSELGVDGDYNHYRTVALKSTSDRAVSIFTNDVSTYIRSIGGGTYANSYREGDLGENVLIDGVGYAFFKVGQRYRFSSNRDTKSGSNSNSLDEVIVEITESMEPCANLCKLSYINDPSLASASERVARCKDFISSLGQQDGLRGWYAKVINGGVIQVGDSVSQAVPLPSQV